MLNYGRYANPAFDSLLVRAQRETDVATARRQWREAMDTLNADAPAIFLYALANRAAVQRRLEDVKLDPYSWLSGLREWRIDRGTGAGEGFGEVVGRSGGRKRPRREVSGASEGPGIQTFDSER